MKTTFAFLLLILLACVCRQAVAQQSVYLKAGQIGGGILKSRNSECFVITPAHVVEDAINGKVEIKGPRETLSQGQLVERFSTDLAIVRVTGTAQNCKEWSIDQNFENILEDTYEGFLEVIQSNGNVKVMKVLIPEKGEPNFIIRPNFADDKIVKGMSGSSVFTKVQDKKVFLGMLTNIDENGNGIVVQASSIASTTNKFFADKTPVIKPAAFKVVEANGFKFEFVESKRSGSNLLCRLLVTSLQKDGRITVVANYYQNSARVYDQRGMEYYPAQVKLGNQVHDGSVGDNYTLVQGVSTPLEFTFKDFSEASTGITMFRFIFNLYGIGDTEVKFKDIALSGLSEKFSVPFKKGIQSMEIPGCDFQLIECVRSGSYVVCKLLVKSNQKDREVHIVANYYQNTARIHDQLGIEYRPEFARLGNQTDPGTVGNNYTLVQDVQTPIEFHFKDVRESATGISLLQFMVDVPGQNLSEVKFKNISFSGETKLTLPAPILGMQARQINGVDVQLVGCRRNGSDVTCKLLIKTTDRDEKVRVIANYYQQSAKAYDQRNNEYLTKTVSLGSQTDAGMVGEDYILVKGV